MKIVPIAHIENDFPDKFGLPRQSAAAGSIRGRVVFEKDFAQPSAVKGLEGFDRLWLIWGFDGPEDRAFHATVRPPKLGGNTRVGVFATRSPFRPNGLGLTCVKLDAVTTDSAGRPVLNVSGLDMKNGTAVYDIKPYLPYTDAYPDARSGFIPDTRTEPLSVTCPAEIMARIPPDRRDTLLEVLRGDPRPGYKDAPGEYGMRFAGFNIRFTVSGHDLTVTDIQEEK